MMPKCSSQSTFPSSIMVTNCYLKHLAKWCLAKSYRDIVLLKELYHISFRLTMIKMLKMIEWRLWWPVVSMHWHVRYRRHHVAEKQSHHGLISCWIRWQHYVAVNRSGLSCWLFPICDTPNPSSWYIRLFWWALYSCSISFTRNNGYGNIKIWWLFVLFVVGEVQGKAVFSFTQTVCPNCTRTVWWKQPSPRASVLPKPRNVPPPSKKNNNFNIRCSSLSMYHESKYIN